MSTWLHTSLFSGFTRRTGSSGGATPPADGGWDDARPDDDAVAHDLRAEGASSAGPAGGAQTSPSDDGAVPRTFAAELSFRRAHRVEDEVEVTDAGADLDGAAAPAFEEFDERAERIPFFRREIRLGLGRRRRDEPEPEPEPAEHESAASRHVVDDVDPAVEDEPEPAPLFIRELSFRAPQRARGSADERPDDDVPAGEPELAAAGRGADVRATPGGEVEWRARAEADVDEPVETVAEAGADPFGEPPLDARPLEQPAVRVPFYRRPIGFHRRRSPVLGAAWEDESVEPDRDSLLAAEAVPDPGAPSGWDDETSGWDEQSAGWEDDLPGWGDPPARPPLALAADDTEPLPDAEVDDRSPRHAPHEDRWVASVEKPEPEDDSERDPAAARVSASEVDWVAWSDEPEEPVTAPAPAHDEHGGEWAPSGATASSGPDEAAVHEEELVPAGESARADDLLDEVGAPVGDEPGWRDPVHEASADVAPDADRETTAAEPEPVDSTEWATDDAPEASPWAEPVVTAAAGGEGDPSGGEDGEGDALDDDAGADRETSAGAGRLGRRRGAKRGTRQAEKGRAGRGTRPGKGRRRVVGLKIGASQLSAAVVADREGAHELVDIARSPLEPGIVVDGEIRDAESLTHALRRFFSEHDLPTKDVRVGLASNRIGVRTFDLVGVEDDERFDNAVRFKAHEVLPIAVQESVLDYRVISERTTETGEALRRVLLVVAPREQVGPYVEVCRDAGLRVAGIDLEALGLLRAFVDPMPLALRSTEDNASVIVSIGHEATTLLVAGGGVCEFTRVFDWGGGTLQEAIASELQLPMAEAATVLRHVSLGGTSSRPLASIDDEQRRVAVEAVRLRLMPFARELVSSLQFYQTQPDSLGIGEIVITGGTAQLEGLAEALNQMLGVTVRVGDPFTRVEVSSDVDPHLLAAPGSLAVAVGLAIEDDRSRGVDLLPSESRQTTRRRPTGKALALPAAALVPVAALGLLFFQASGQVSDKEGELSALSRELAALPEPKGVKIDPALQGEQAQRATAVADVLARRLAWDRVLGDLSRVVPENVWLTQLTAKAATPLATDAAQAVAASSRPTGVTISGFTYQHADVARLLARLAAVPSLANVELGSSTAAVIGKVGQTQAGREVVQFTIVANMSQAGGAQ